jgi:CspA family cold shock protein
MSEGKVKWFNTRKGYGFVSTVDGPDIFVHYSSISGKGYRTLAEGDSVSFDIVEGEKGLRAENVVRVSASESETVSKDKTPAENKAASKGKAVSKSKKEDL